MPEHVIASLAYPDPQHLLASERGTDDVLFGWGAGFGTAVETTFWHCDLYLEA
jgi:hypothetical protein